MKKPLSDNYGQVDYPIFGVAALCSTVFYLPMVIFKEEVGQITPWLMRSVTHSLDWCFLILGFVSLIFSLWLAFGRYGRVKFGKKTDKSEFSNITWFAMFFCAGVGAGTLYWAFLEPMNILQNPPFQVEPLSEAAREWTLAYSFFHWTITPWSIYAIPSVAFAYSYYNRGVKFLRPSYATSGILGDKSFGIIGKIIDIVVIIGMLGGLTSALAFAFPMLSRLVADYFGIADTMLLLTGIGLLFALVIGYSCFRGLYSGIANLANFNLFLFGALLIYFFFVGPSTWILSYFVDSLGILLQNYLRLSFYTDSISLSSFPQDWTVFYWAWWLGWSIFIGLFMARISKGRTMRAFILNLIFSAGFGMAVIFTVLNGYTQYVYFDMGVDIFSALNKSGGPAAISVILNTVPGSVVVIPIFIIMLFIAQATGYNSASYTLANISCSEILDGQEPPRWVRIFWVTFLLLATLSLIWVGGVQVVKLAAILTSTPLVILQVIFMLSIVRWLRNDFGAPKLMCIDDIDDNDTNEQ